MRPALLVLSVLLASCGSSAGSGLGSPAPREGPRQIPVGLARVENQVFPSKSYVYAIRFVVDRPTRVWRFFSGFNVEGAFGVGGRRGYAAGSGGVIRARLVRVDRHGRPDLRRVLAGERVGAVRRYVQTMRAYGLGSTRTALLYFNLRGVKLAAGRMYAMTYQNVSRRPRGNYFSTDSPTVKASEAGPNGRNNRSPKARGPIAGLDPREAVAWSRDGGRRWVWGRRVGEGRLPGTYVGSRTGDGGTRLPWFGWQPRPGAARRSNQPYYAYGRYGSFTLLLRGAPRAVTLREAGGYAPAGRRVGTVTVVNSRTGASGRTQPLGGGIARGQLDRPVQIAAGDSYAISNSGSVYKAEGDSFIRSIFRVGVPGGSFPFTSPDGEADRPELFALPHPWFPRVK